MNTWTEMSFEERLAFMKEWYINVGSGSTDEELTRTDYKSLPGDLQEILQQYD
jgi:hypothetical protein